MSGQIQTLSTNEAQFIFTKTKPCNQSLFNNIKMVAEATRSLLINAYLNIKIRPQQIGTILDMIVKGISTCPCQSTQITPDGMILKLYLKTHDAKLQEGILQNRYKYPCTCQTSLKDSDISNMLNMISQWDYEYQLPILECFCCHNAQLRDDTTRIILNMVLQMQHDKRTQGVLLSQLCSNINVRLHTQDIRSILNVIAQSTLGDDLKEEILYWICFHQQQLEDDTIRIILNITEKLGSVHRGEVLYSICHHQQQLEYNCILDVIHIARRCPQLTYNQILHILKKANDMGIDNEDVQNLSLR